MKEPGINATATAELLVAPTDLASALSLEAGDSYPPVFSTSRMVALMEIAASRVLSRQAGPVRLKESEAKA